MGLEIKAYFHMDTNSLSYLVYDSQSLQALVIDPVLDFDLISASIAEQSVNSILTEIKTLGLQLEWILETHIHADHLSAAQILKQETGAKIVIGAGVEQVQKTFNQLYDLQRDSRATSADFDCLMQHQDIFNLGDIPVKVLHTPGHTASCCTYLINDNAFVGDTLFMPDYGTARCDFPGGDAHQLYHSIQQIYALPDTTAIYLCHDYMPNGRELQWRTTVAQQKQFNVHLNQQTTESQFVSLRQQRDSTLSTPRLMLSALQVNIRAGKLPQIASNGIRYLRLPLNQLTREPIDE